MVVCKILWVCVAVVAMNARESQSNVLIESTKDCTCFPASKDSTRISKLADKYGKHERKVIYLFKHPDTLEVTIYVPNEEKQTNFPDLTVNSFEFYGLPKSQHLYQIFVNPSNILPVVDPSHSIETNYTDLDILNMTNTLDGGDPIISQNPHRTDIKTNTNSTGPELNPGTIGNPDIVHHLIPSDNGEKGPNYVDPSTGHKNMLLEVHKHPNGVDLNGKQTIHVIDDIHLVPDYEKMIADYLNRPKQHVVDNANLNPGHDNHGLLNHDSHGILNHDSHGLLNDDSHNLLNHDSHGLLNQDNHVHSHIDNIYVDLENDGKVLDIYDKTISPLDGTVENINIIFGEDNHYPSNLNKNTKNINPDTIGLHITDTVLPNRVIPEELKPTHGPHNILDNMMVDTEFNFIKNVQELLSGNKNNAIPPSVNLKPANSPVLDKWLVEEITHVGNSGPGTSSPDTVDLLEIKIRLLYVLEQNGLRFTENGDLNDAHGNVFKISNLKLRRVMISDPLVYKKLLGGRKCVMPYDIPYLEAVFVSLVYPPKVLGLIPLKLSTIPRCKGGKCTGKICNSKKEKSFIALVKGPQKLHLAPIYNTKFKKYEILLPRIDSGDKNEDVSQIPPHTELGVNDRHDHHEGGDKTPPGDGDDDGLGIRIIGGHPATSSGTPVISKGRSGNRGSGQSSSI